jgi:hypothetical protein
MMDMVTVRLVFYGLMAFAPNDSSPTSINALLLDAQGHHYASDGCKLPSHVPALYVKAAGCTARDGRLGDGEPVSCELSTQVALPVDRNSASGSWLLNAEHLSLEIEAPDGNRKKQLIAHRSQGLRHPLPSNPEEAQDLAWLPALPAADRNCLGPADDCPIAARFEIDDGEVTTCQLFQSERGGPVNAFELRPLGVSTLAASSSPQAIAGAVLASVTVPRGSKIRIISHSFAGAWRNRESPLRTIELEAGDQPTIDVWVTNLPTSHTDMGPDHACHGQSIDRHYEMYYNLLARRVPFAQRSVPHSVELFGDPEKAQPPSEKSCQPLPLIIDDRLPGNWLACGSVWIDSNES